ncbi:45186_t:CDS:2, partial [Gigaspora margarita]
KLLVVLRDGRKLIGVLRSFDQFANLVLQDTIERIYVGDAYGDIPRGIFIIRGENVVLLGEIEDELPLRQVPVEEILLAQREEMEARQRREKLKNKLLHDQGFSVDFTETDLY